MGKPTTQNNNSINHFSHPHRLQLTPATSSPPCSACKLAGGNSRIFSCRPCNFSLHETCSKMKQVITHPSHPAHTLSLLVAPVYEGGYFNCDGCGIIGTGFCYQCSRCDFDIHALCAYKPVSISHKSHPQHSLQLAFQSPYGANKGFSCDICLTIGKNQWLYQCIPCEFDAHVGCISAQFQPHLLQHSNSAPTHHTPHAGIPHHQNSLPMPNQARPRPMTRPRPRPMNRPGPIGNPNRPVGVQNTTAYGPRRHNNNLAYNGQVGPIGANEIIGQERESFGQGSMDGSGYDGSVGTAEFEGEIDVEVEYEVNVYEGIEDGEANEEGEDVDANGLEIVAYGDEYGVACSESEFGGSSDARSQCNDLPEADLYPLSLDNTQGPPLRINQGSGGGRGKKKNANQNGSTTRSKNMNLNGARNAPQSPVGPQTRRVPNVRNNAIRASNGAVRFNRPRDPTAFNTPQGSNGPMDGSSNAIDNYNNNEADMYGGVDNVGGYDESYGDDYAGGEDNVGGYDESYGDDYAGGDGDCDFEGGGDFVNNDYGDQAYDETYDENDFESYTGGSESMYDGEEYDGTMGDSQYGGVNDVPNNQYLPVVGSVGGLGQNQYDQTGRPRNMGRYGRGGTTHMNRNVNMYQGGNSAQPRPIGRRGQFRPNGGPNGPNGPNGNMVMNTMVQSLCQGFAMNMLVGGGGDINGEAADGGGTSIVGGLFGGDSGF